MKIKTSKEAYHLFDMLGIYDISSNTQTKNGTTVWELPIKQLTPSGTRLTYKYATYESGYIRDVSYRCWQINKVKSEQVVYQNGFHGFNRTRTLIQDPRDRLVYLANYILKNRYNNDSVFEVNDWAINSIADNYDKTRGGGYTDELAHVKAQCIKTPFHLNVHHNKMINSCDNVGEVEFLVNHYAKVGTPSQDVKVIIDGHRYNL
tara:strand:+ start:123 stop:737 length:615 start_codon:yes stop_codon:yes gene_type:complete